MPLFDLSSRQEPSVTAGRSLFSPLPPAFAVVPQYLFHIPIDLLRRVAAHLTVRSPHRSPPADFPHGPLQQLIHSRVSFSAIPSSPVCMAGLFLSLYKGPKPPFAWSPCFP